MKKQDHLWKGIIEDFFEDFLSYFYKKHLPKFDLEKGYEFLDKELQTIFPESEETRRFVDMLVKVYLKNGKAVFVLIHIEIQGYSDENFQQRMFIYQYRIFERLRIHPEGLAILTDDNPNYHPKDYSVKILDSRLQYDFSTYNLAEMKLEDFQNSDNPFALILETAWWGLKKNKLTEEQLFRKKLSLYRRLLELGLPNKKVHDLLSFIKYYHPFENEEITLKFEESVNQVKNQTMGVQEAIINHSKEEGEKIGIQKGEKIGIDKTLKIIELLGAGKSVKAISKELNIEEALVQKVKDMLQSD